ncbi:MAG: tetratricopeptide repeat protein, partial [Candidatus Dormibacteraeota bacterium]|nr:tetratricopeptide repeat protein [Candidatus Dormibacteraeota bacterium]
MPGGTIGAAAGVFICSRSAVNRPLPLQLALMITHREDSAMTLEPKARPARRALITGNSRILPMAVTLFMMLAACSSKSPADKAGDELQAGLAASAAGNVDEATTHYKACIALDSTNKYCIFDLGVIAQTANRLLEAENDYRLALLLDPDFAPALYNLAILRTATGGLDEAIALYRHLIEVDPTNASGHFNLGLALAASGDIEGGQKELAEGVRLNPALVIPSPLPGPSGSP